MFGNLGDMMGMMGKMKEIQARMKTAQDSLGTLSATGESGAGLLEIDPSLLVPDDREMLQDLVVAATNKAQEAIDPKIKDHLRQATEGLLPNIPGMDLGSMMG
jgi:nucleoid-associated protein EbfC